MQIKFSTRIASFESDSLTNTKEIISESLSSDYTENQFKSSQSNSKTLVLDPTKSIQLTPINVFSYLGVEKENCSFLHIQLKDNNIETIGNNIPTFIIQIGSVYFEVDQFSLLNVRDISEDIIIYEIKIPESSKAVLTIVIGEK